ncbi:MAG: DNA polymerase III subunit chi [Rhodoferax sp.]|nr:DNA polymerase III subunit chi [Rhodoferax sp.]
MSAAVTDVAFHFGAPDKVAYTVRLLRKAVGTGARVMVVAEIDTLERLDAALWTSVPSDFLTHCWVNATGPVAALSAVVLSNGGPDEAAPLVDVLVNLGDAMPTAFERFPRVIEVVSLDDGDRQQARQRWKTYATQGYAIDRRDLNLRN